MVKGQRFCWISDKYISHADNSANKLPLIVFILNNDQFDVNKIIFFLVLGDFLGTTIYLSLTSLKSMIVFNIAIRQCVRMIIVEQTVVTVTPRKFLRFQDIN